MIEMTAFLATEAPPKMFETGWTPWHWVLMWGIFGLSAAGATLLTALMPAIVEWAAEGFGVRRLLLAVLTVVLGVGFLGGVLWLPGPLLRHMDSSGGAGAVFWVCLAVVAVLAILGGKLLHWEKRWLPWVMPTFGLFGTVGNGIAELITRLAAQLPMGVGQFLGVVGAIVLIALCWGGGAMFTSSRR